MSNRLLRAILLLYPRAFRRRYGPEMQDLVNELEAAGDRSRLRLVGGLLLSAAAERLRAVRLDARLAIHALAGVAALGTIVGVTSSPGGRHFPRHVANAEAYVPLATKPSMRRTGGAAIATSPGSPAVVWPTAPTAQDTGTATGGTGTPGMPSDTASSTAPTQGTASTTGTGTSSVRVPPVAGSTMVTPSSISSATGTADTSVTPGQ